MSNDNIVNVGKATRFGQAGGADPNRARREANPPWSVRNAMRRIAAYEFDVSNGVQFEDILRVFDPKLKSITAAQLLAAKHF